MRDVCMWGVYVGKVLFQSPDNVQISVNSLILTFPESSPLSFLVSERSNKWGHGYV